MGCCHSHEQVEVVYQDNAAREAADAWNSRRADVVKNLEALSDLYYSIESRAERNRLIDTNRAVFEEFFDLPPTGDSFQTKVDQMLRQGLHRYVKPVKGAGAYNGTTLSG